MFIIGTMVVLFSISNRETVTLDFWPLPFFHQTSIYLPILVSGCLGFLFGCIIAWFAAGSTRSKARQANRRASGLEKDLATLQSKIHELDEKRKNAAR